MRVWIDATHPRSALHLFGMTLLERQLHTLVEAGLEPTQVSVVLPSDTQDVPTLPGGLRQRLPIRWSHESGALQDRLARMVHEANGEAILALEADAVIDARLLRYIGEQTGSLAARGGEGAGRTVVLRLEGGLPGVASADARLLELADAGVNQGICQDLPLEHVPAYIKKLRRHLPVYLFRITDQAGRDQAERFLFWSNYKGSTDFFTKYVYPPLVWQAVRPLARWRVHPNAVTLFNVFITFAAVPLFAQGRWIAGLALAYTMSILDSVDGKLARLTFCTSRVGDWLDHGLDIIHPPVWYFAWAWALSNGEPAALVFRAAVWMAVFYVLDRIVIGLFNRRTGRSIHGYTPFDERVRTFISRRNINVPLFTVGLIAGIPTLVFYLIVVWQVATLGFHAARLLRFWNRKTALAPVG